jgi:ClpA/ClpB-like protein
MTPLDPGVLTEARSARDRLLELQRDLEKARADYNHAVRHLHAAGGSLREIAENLGLSHQRVHQIVEGREASGRPLRRARPRRFGWPFERFTRRARQVVVLAQEEAETLGHGRVGTEHLLLGLLRSEDEAVAPVLAEAGVALDAARTQARELVDEETSRRRAPFTRAAKRALGNALHEARTLGDNFIGAEHVLLGLLDDERAGAVAMLRALGTDPASLREATVRRRRSASAG